MDMEMRRSDGVCSGVILSRSNNTSRASHTDAVLFHFPEPANDENHLLPLADHVIVLPVVVVVLPTASVFGFSLFY